MAENDGFEGLKVGGHRRVIGGDVLPTTEKYIDAMPRKPMNCWLRRKRHHLVLREERQPLGPDYEVVRVRVVCRECGYKALMGPHMFKAAGESRG